jgi:RHS repeat-associated protein
VTYLHENWNRFYDPGSGRYLSPEPMLRDARFAQGRAGAGLITPAYAYADNNPITVTDPSGLYSANVPPGKTCDLDVSRGMQGRVKTSANRVTDECLRKCVIERLDKMVFQCGTAESEKRCKKSPTAVASATLGESCSNPAADAFWCNRAKGMNENCVVDALVHEAAHNCGWNHRQGKGVPGNEGHITTNCSDKPPGPSESSTGQ